MPKPRAYVETTVPNFYYDFRDSAEVVSRRDVTCRWWANAPDLYELVTGTFVHHELAAGTSPAAKLRVQLIDSIPILPTLPEIDRIVESYLRHKLMPAKPLADAFHLALASYYRCGFLVTWNCQHLANPNKAEHIRHINTRLGLAVPRLVTPLELLEGTSDV